ncbi:hypothetical protein ACS0TY_016436 [Phlomoides rotata]
MCTSALASEFREDCKFYTADKEGELHKFMWLFKDQRLTVPHWQNQRSYLMAQKVMTCLTPDPLKQEPLVVENAPDPLAGEQLFEATFSKCTTDMTLAYILLSRRGQQRQKWLKQRGISRKRRRKRRGCILRAYQSTRLHGLWTILILIILIVMKLKMMVWW